jgi:hypothetical protein
MTGIIGKKVQEKNHDGSQSVTGSLPQDYSWTPWHNLNRKIKM